MHVDDDCYCCCRCRSLSDGGPPFAVSPSGRSDRAWEGPASQQTPCCELWRRSGTAGSSSTRDTRLLDRRRPALRNCVFHGNCTKREMWVVWRNKPWNCPGPDPWLMSGWNRGTSGVCDAVWKRKRRLGGVFYGGSCRDLVHLVSMVA